MSYSYTNSDFSEEDIALLQLSLCDGIGPKLSYQLLEIAGSAKGLFQTVNNKSGAMPNSFLGLGPQKLLQLQQASSFAEAHDVLNIHQKLNIGMVTINHTLYPHRIKEQSGAPLVLFYQGSTAWNLEHSVAVVGTRKPSQRGLSITQEIVTNLQHHMPRPWYTVSGLAMGIDAMAHKSSVDLKIPSIGIVAHGLEQIYPRNHKRLTQEILEHGGAILSEHPAYTKMHPNLFPRRNRLVAALSDALLIVESGTSGGSMVTAGIACHLNKDVFAIPGHPKDSHSTGCNSLIQECMAHLCTSAEDILDKMNWHKTEKPLSLETKQIKVESYAPNQNQFNAQQREVLNLIDAGNSRIQDLTAALPFLSIAELLAITSQLQIQGILIREQNQEFRILKHSP